MRRLRNFSLFATAIVSLTACTTFGEKQSKITGVETVPAQVSSSAIKGSSTVALTSLADSSLPRGACGMVLWTLDANRPIPVLRYVAGDTGEFRLNRIPYELIRVNVGGNASFGIFPIQSFAAGANIEVSVELQFGQGFDGGTYLERGVISIEQPDSPTLVTPIAGIAGCRAK